jgi:hypothetical protein
VLAISNPGRERPPGRISRPHRRGARRRPAGVGGVPRRVPGRQMRVHKTLSKRPFAHRSGRTADPSGWRSAVGTVSGTCMWVRSAGGTCPRWAPPCRICGRSRSARPRFRNCGA